jgi:hypothetical protein
MNSALNFKILVGILSYPHEFLAFRDLIMFLTSFVEV